MANSTSRSNHSSDEAHSLKSTIRMSESCSQNTKSAMLVKDWKAPGRFRPQCRRPPRCRLAQASWAHLTSSALPYFHPLLPSSPPPPLPSSPLPLFPSSPLPLFPSSPLPLFPSSPLPLFPSSPLPLFPSSPLPLFPALPEALPRSRHFPQELGLQEGVPASARRSTTPLWPLGGLSIEQPASQNPRSNHRQAATAGLAAPCPAPAVALAVAPALPLQQLRRLRGPHALGRRVLGPPVRPPGRRHRSPATALAPHMPGQDAKVQVPWYKSAGAMERMNNTANTHHDLLP